MSDAQRAAGAEGSLSHVPGEDQSDGSAAGVAPGGRSLEAGLDPQAPAMDSLDSSGDSMGDDAALPEKGLPGDGDSIAGETDAATGDGPVTP